MTTMAADFLKRAGAQSRTIVFTLAAAGVAMFPVTATAQTVIEAATVSAAITIDGDVGEWAGVPGVTVRLAGDGGVDSVEIKAAVYGDTIYLLAVWSDPTENRQHKPYRWDDATQSYKKQRELEDRFAISFRMSGKFSANKIDGSIFVADVWHWKAARSDPAGVAHDKMWKTSGEPFEKSKEWTNGNGTTIYLARLSDAGTRLYKPVKYDAKEDDVMPGYKVTMSPQGSIADVAAKGVWRDGRWYLELARKLDTGNPDDVVISAEGSIEIAIAAFNGVDGRKHSVSNVLVLKTSR